MLYSASELIHLENTQLALYYARSLIRASWPVLKS